MTVTKHLIAALTISITVSEIVIELIARAQWRQYGLIRGEVVSARVGSKRVVETLSTKFEGLL